MACLFRKEDMTVDLYEAKRASANGIIDRNIYRLKEQWLSLWASATINANNTIIV